MLNKNYFVLVLVLILFFPIIKSFFPESIKLENFSTSQCNKSHKDNDDCKKCTYPKLNPCKPDCKPDCRPECPDMKRYVLKSKIPPCPECPDMSAYILKSEIPPCPPQPDLSKYVLKTTVPPCKCPPCPKIDCPKLPKVISPDCPKITRHLEQLSKDLVFERRRSNQLEKENLNNGCKINGISGSYSRPDLKKIVDFYEHYKTVSRKYQENIKIKEKKIKNNSCLDSSFGSANGSSFDSITNPYDYLSNTASNYNIPNNNMEQTETYKMHKSIFEKFKSIF